MSKLKSSKSLTKVNRFLTGTFLILFCFLIVDDNVFKTHLLFNKLFGKDKTVAQKAITIFISKNNFLRSHYCNPDFYTDLCICKSVHTGTCR